VIETKFLKLLMMLMILLNLEKN